MRCGVLRLVVAAAVSDEAGRRLADAFGAERGSSVRARSRGLDAEIARAPGAGASTRGARGGAGRRSLGAPRRTAGAEDSPRGLRGAVGRRSPAVSPGASVRRGRRVNSASPRSPTCCSSRGGRERPSGARPVARTGRSDEAARRGARAAGTSGRSVWRGACWRAVPRSAGVASLDQGACACPDVAGALGRASRGPRLRPPGLAGRAGRSRSPSRAGLAEAQASERGVRGLPVLAAARAGLRSGWASSSRGVEPAGRESRGEASRRSRDGRGPARRPARRSSPGRRGALTLSLRMLRAWTAFGTNRLSVKPRVA